MNFKRVNLFPQILYKIEMYLCLKEQNCRQQSSLVFNIMNLIAVVT